MCLAKLSANSGSEASSKLVDLHADQLRFMQNRVSRAEAKAEFKKRLTQYARYEACIADLWPAFGTHCFNNEGKKLSIAAIQLRELRKKVHECEDECYDGPKRRPRTVRTGSRGEVQIKRVKTHIGKKVPVTPPPTPRARAYSTPGFVSPPWGSMWGA